MIGTILGIAGLVLVVLYPNLTALIMFGIAAWLTAPYLYKRLRDIRRR